MVGSLDPDDRVDGTAEHDARREAEALGRLASDVERTAPRTLDGRFRLDVEDHRSTWSTSTWSAIRWKG